MGICCSFFKSFLVISNDNKYIYLFYYSGLKILMRESLYFLIVGVLFLIILIFYANGYIVLDVV